MSPLDVLIWAGTGAVVIVLGLVVASVVAGAIKAFRRIIEDGKR